ncbi:Protein kinase domain-containing protein [Caenorhabditis elegans]|uniref:Protein kinase domain-containing protein n=1 Tax=Caenorhabditis elegans TaxID=6239 RepID=Q19942_CAEEL|nr:Protein kinase domain-containing protein [Caenorhabditis elegans]CAA93748.2 Protein kinase domain-containing protein [Caenorhabditis elegans]|eukprot:NP_510468.2 Uncharacterized protein CELE_F31F6.1 [Caenorhabditis elegans]
MSIEQSFQHLACAPTSLNLIWFTVQMGELAKKLPFKEAKTGLIKSIAHILHDEKFEKIRGDEAMLNLFEMLAKCSTKIGGAEVYKQAYGLDLFNYYKEFYFQWAHECGKMKSVSQFRTVFHLARCKLGNRMSPTLIEKDFEKIFQQYFGMLSMQRVLGRTGTLDQLFAKCSFEELMPAENVRSLGTPVELSGGSVTVLPHRRVLEVIRETMSSSDILPNKSESSILLDGSPSTIWSACPNDSLELLRARRLKKCELQSTVNDVVLSKYTESFSMSGQPFNDRSSAKSKGMFAQNLAISTTVDSQKDILHRGAVRGNSVLEASTCSTPKEEISFVDVSTYMKNQQHQDSATMPNAVCNFIDFTYLL